MLRILAPAILLLALSLSLPQDVQAATFTAENVGSSTINASAASHSITIYITDTDPSLNILKANITLYSFTFVSGTNSTTASAASFSNASPTSIGWSNSTDNISLIASGGGVQNFTFNVNVPLTTGTYSITVTVTDTAAAQASTNITYSVVDNPIYQITFANLSNMTQTTNLIQNLSHVVRITNDGGLRKTYNLTVVDCNNISQTGVGILNASSVVLNASEAKAIQLNVINSTSGLYSSCIMAKHYNGSADPSNVTSIQNSVILNSGFYPDINVTAIFYTSSGGNSPYPGGNITMNVTLNNTGQFNFLGSVGVYLLWDGVVVNNTVLIDNTSLPYGTPYSYVGFPNIIGITAGLHNLTVWADYTNSLVESNEANNNLTAQVFAGYNVTGLTVTGHSSYNAYSNKSVNVSVYVYYPNGTAVTGLTKYNFSVYDQQTGVTFNSGIAVFNDSFTAGAAGFYWFNITTPALVNATATLPGTHNLTVNASRDEGSRAYSGGSSGLDYYYLLVPKLVVVLSAISNSVTEGNSRAITISVTNTGTDPIYNVTLAPSLDSTYLSGGSIGGCTPILPVIPNIVVASTGYITCSASVVAEEVSDDTSTSYIVTATGSYNYSGTVTTFYTADDITLLVVNAAAGGGDDGGGGGTNATSCTTDNQCKDTESCVNRKCAAISCPNGEIMDHFCITVTYKINITAFPSAISAGSGESNSTKVTVKNTGADKFTAKLEVTINNITATVTPASYSLDAGESYQFTVDFTVPNSTTIGEFAGTFKAYVSTSTSSYQSKSFKFTVFPKEETKVLINVSYGELETLLAAAASNLSQMKASGMFNQSVISAIESLISAANTTLLQMKSAIDSDDYVTAQSLISQVNTSISSANAQIGGARVQTSGFTPLQYGIWFWVAIAVIIIFVVGFFVYMFYPSGHVGFHPEKGYAHPAAKEGVAARIKKLFKRKKDSSPPTSIKTIAQSVAEPSKEGQYETFHYGHDYSKEKSYGYEFSKGADTGGGFLQRFRRKKRAETPQMHLDQFSGQPVAEQKKEDTPQSPPS
jgi:hypothetical protein